MKLAVATVRFLRGLVHALGGLFTIVFVFPRLSEAQRQDRVQAWAAGLLPVVGIRLEVHGAPVDRGPVLMVANHLSWLDITVLHAGRHCRFVSKAEVHHWPIIGRLASGAGTLFIERESRRDALRVVHHMAEALRAGDVLAVFPEGTTSDGQDVLPFHANLLQAAITADAPVQPVALDYLEAATRQAARGPLYIDDDTLVGSIWRTLTGPPVVAVVRYGSLQRADGRGRRAWAQGLREAVQALRSTP
jgi:1-acyl-sn-glycerol-3-phosphate acyltransferase